MLRPVEPAHPLRQNRIAWIGYVLTVGVLGCVGENKRFDGVFIADAGVDSGSSLLVFSDTGPAGDAATAGQSAPVADLGSSVEAGLSDLGTTAPEVGLPDSAGQIDRSVPEADTALPQPDTTSHNLPPLSASLVGERLVVEGGSRCTEGNALNLSGFVDSGRWRGWRRLTEDPDWDTSAAAWTSSLRGDRASRVWRLVWRDSCRTPAQKAEIWVDCLAAACVALSKPPAQPSAPVDPTVVSKSLRADLFGDAQGSRLTLSGAGSCTWTRAQQVNRSEPAGEWTQWVLSREASGWSTDSEPWTFPVDGIGEGEWHLIWHDGCTGGFASLWVDCRPGGCVIDGNPRN